MFSFLVCYGLQGVLVLKEVCEGFTYNIWIPTKKTIFLNGELGRVYIVSSKGKFVLTDNTFFITDAQPNNSERLNPVSRVR